MPEADRGARGEEKYPARDRRPARLRRNPERTRAARRCSTNWIRRRSVTGTTSGTSRSRKTSASSITRNGSAAIGPRAFGCHLQDCIWPAQDHQPPFAGDVDLEKLVPLLPNDCLFVWEMSPRKTAERNPPLGRRLARALRRMKKVLALAPPDRGHDRCPLLGFSRSGRSARKWRSALRTADYRWIVAAIVAYFMVEFAAAIRWQILLRVQKIHLSIAARLRPVPDRDVLQPVPARRHRRRHLKSYLLLKETPGQGDRRAPRRRLRSHGRAGRADQHHRHADRPALRLAHAASTRRKPSRLAAHRHPRQRRPHAASLHLSSAASISLTRCRARFPGREKLIELSASYHLYAHHWRATLRLSPPRSSRISRPSPPFSASLTPSARASAVLDFFAIMPIERTISSLPISFAGVGLREKIFQVMLQWPLRRAGGGRGPDRLDEFSRHAHLLRAGRDRLFPLQAERPDRAREVEARCARKWPRSSMKSPRRVSHRANAPAPRPFVAATFAMTVDGKITTRTFSPVDFTSREDKRHLLRQRSLGDAVLIGRSTLTHDNVRLGLPDPKMREEREARGQTPYPLRVIVSNEGRIDPALNIFQTDFSRILIFSTTRMPRKFQNALREKATLRLSESHTVDLALDAADNCGANTECAGSPARAARNSSAACSSGSWSISSTSRSRPTFSAGKTRRLSPDAAPLSCRERALFVSRDAHSGRRMFCRISAQISADKRQRASVAPIGDRQFCAALLLKHSLRSELRGLFFRAFREIMQTGNSIIMHAPREAIFETAADLELWPKILPHYRYIRFLERGPQTQHRGNGRDALRHSDLLDFRVCSRPRANGTALSTI